MIPPEPNMSTTVPPPPFWITEAEEWDAVPNPFTDYGDSDGYDKDDSPPTPPSSINWTGGANYSSGEAEESQGFLWVTMVTSIPSLLGIALFSLLLVYIILKRLRDIMELYLSVLAYASSQVHNLQTPSKTFNFL
eukprot:sb/3474696/